MSNKRIKQLVDWFYEHDTQWQNDIMAELDMDTATEKFWDEIELRYGSNIPEEE